MQEDKNSHQEQTRSGRYYAKGIVFKRSQLLVVEKPSDLLLLVSNLYSLVTGHACPQPVSGGIVYIFVKYAI